MIYYKPVKRLNKRKKILYFVNQKIEHGKVKMPASTLNLISKIQEKYKTVTKRSPKTCFLKNKKPTNGLT